MSTMEKIAKINKVDIKSPLIEEENLIVFATMCSKVVVSAREKDIEGYNWNTQIFSI